MDNGQITGDSSCKWVVFGQRWSVEAVEVEYERLWIRDHSCRQMGVVALGDNWRICVNSRKWWGAVKDGSGMSVMMESSSKCLCFVVNRCWRLKTGSNSSNSSNSREQLLLVVKNTLNAMELAVEPVG